MGLGLGNGLVSNIDIILELDVGKTSAGLSYDLVSVPLAGRELLKSVNLDGRSGREQQCKCK